MSQKKQSIKTMRINHYLAKKRRNSGIGGNQDQNKFVTVRDWYVRMKYLEGEDHRWYFGSDQKIPQNDVVKKFEHEWEKKPTKKSAAIKQAHWKPKHRIHVEVGQVWDVLKLQSVYIYATQHQTFLTNTKTRILFVYKRLCFHWFSPTETNFGL